MRQTSVSPDLPERDGDRFKHWRLNLAMIWTAQFICSIGFSFGLPFTAFFLQEDLGITNHNEVASWMSAFGAACPLTMMIFAPIWGAIADRFGRKKMLLRSYVGGFVALGCMGLVHSPGMLIFLRLVQGMFCGTVSAAQTLISTQTPEEHNGFALGSLNSAMFSGTIAGAFLGGYVAEWYGYRNAFFCSAIMMATAFVLVFFFVHEVFTPVEHDKVSSPIRVFFLGLLPNPKTFLELLPILLIMGFVMFARDFDVTFISLLVQELNNHMVEGASRLTGALSAVCGIGGVISGFLLGWLADHIKPGALAVFSALLAALFMGVLFFTASLVSLFVFRFFMIFISSGIDPSLQLWLSRKTNAQTRGQMFGWASSMRSMGYFTAPLAGGLVVQHLGFDVRGLYLVGPALYILSALFLIMAMRHYHEQ